MEVNLRPAPFRIMRGCLGIMTLGLIPWMLRRQQDRFIARMDDDGFQTRGGRRLAWTDVTAIRRVQGTMDGKVLSDELQLSTTKGTVSLPLWRAEDPAGVRDYALRHLPNLRVGG